MALSERENHLRNVTFAGPEWIPCTVVISNASWDQLRGDVEDVLARHPTLFPGFQKGQRDYDHFDFGPANRADERFRDAWGCVWVSTVNGLEGQVVEHPLEDWDSLDSYKAPDPLTTADRGPADWEAIRQSFEQAKREGHLTGGSVPHGYLFMRLGYLRGFESFLLDVAADDPRLRRLIDVVQRHNKALVGQYLRLGVDQMSFNEDLGAQSASILSPSQFRKWIAPSYHDLMRPCRDAGAHVSLHSDGHIMELMDDLIAVGVDIINPQDLCNGIDNLVREVKGRVCINLDVDRQTVVPFGTRQEIRALIEEEVRKLGSPRGGLSFIVGIYPPTPPENVDALLDAFEEFRTYWWEGPRKRTFPGTGN